MKIFSKIPQIIGALILAIGVSACASHAPAPATSGLAHHSIEAAEIVGKTLFVPRGDDSPRYELTFHADGSWSRTTFGPQTQNWTGTWKILPNGDVAVSSKTKAATLSFFGPAADGSFTMVSSNGARTPKYVTLR